MNRKNEIAAGALFLIAMAVYMAGSELVVSGLDLPNQFADIQRAKIQLGVVLEFINSAAVVGIAVLLVPIVRRYSEATAAAYGAARVIEAVLLLIGSVCALLIPQMSAEAVQLLGTSVVGFRDLLFQFGMISLGIGSIGLCIVLFRFQLVPRWLGLLGIVGYLALTASGFLGLFGITNVGMILFVPGSLFELIFPIWLIFKGLNRSQEISALS